ncbi:hypothetical protein EQG49_08105 [Periweissella cryptocerci]|uniref:Uncharacterized protein n=1 Tax=Periweissella cryptocerci TaxID=2506420 RepID=A0A4P6YUL1_9LACO|nr:hypothetical protein [Periweissella cryptocerci]QBO36432.1 hypothetical protein EQG49_08105 [Periweissella cryptocerci]
MSKKIILACIVMVAILGIKLSPLSVASSPPLHQYNITMSSTLEQQYLDDVMETETTAPFYVNPQASWKKALSEVFTSLRSTAQQSIANLYFEADGQPLPIFQTTLAAQLHQGITLVSGSASLTNASRQTSTLLATAPNTINAFAGHLPNMSVGALFYIHSGTSHLTYQVVKQQIIDKPINNVIAQPKDNGNYVTLAVPMIQANQNVTLAIQGQLLANDFKAAAIPKQWFMPIALLILMVIISIWVFWATYHIVWQIFFK